MGEDDEKQGVIINADDVNATQRLPAVVFASLSPGQLRIVLMPGVGMFNGGIPTDVTRELIPDGSRLPNSRLWVTLEGGRIVKAEPRSADDPAWPDRPDPESPADEFERLLAERRSQAERDVKVSAGIAAAMHGTALSSLCAGMMTNEDGFALLFLVLWCGSAVVAGVAGILTLRRWSSLSAWWITLGLLPWGVVASELSLPILAVLLYTV